MIDPREFRMTLGRFATGVTVVTARLGEDVHGITVNAFMSVSLEPPLVLVSIDRQAKANRLLRASGRYGVSVLAEDQEPHSDHFAGRPSALSVALQEVAGVPTVRGALAQLVCRTEQIVEAGDHTLFVGLVEHLSYREGKPLLYFAGRYAHLAETR